MTDQETPVEYRYFKGSKGVFRVPLNKDSAEDLGYILASPESFTPITEFQFEKEQEKQKIRDRNVVQNVIGGISRGIAADLSWGASDAAEANFNPAEYFAYREEYPGSILAGEIGSAVGTSIPGVIAGTAVGGPLGAVGAATGQAAIEIAQFEARKNLKKQLLKETGRQLVKGGGSRATAFVGEVGQQALQEIIKKRVEGKVKQKIASGAALLGGAAAELTVDAGIRGFITGAGEAAALNPDDTVSDWFLAGADAASENIKTGLEFGSYIAGGVGLLKGGVEIGRKARGSKIFQEKVSPKLASAYAKLGVSKEYQADVAELVGRVMRGDADQIEVEGRLATATSLVDQSAENLKDIRAKLRGARAQKALAKREISVEKTGFAEQAAEKAREAADEFQPGIDELRTQVDEAAAERVRQEGVVRDDQAVAQQVRQSLQESRKDISATKKDATELRKEIQQNDADILSSRREQLDLDIAQARAELEGIRAKVPEDVAKAVAESQAKIDTLAADANKLELDLTDVNKSQAELDSITQALNENKEKLTKEQANLRNLRANAVGQTSKESSEQIINRRVSEVDKAIQEGADEATLRSMEAELDNLLNNLELSRKQLFKTSVERDAENKLALLEAFAAITSSRQAAKDAADLLDSEFTKDMTEALTEARKVLGEETKSLTQRAFVDLDGNLQPLSAAGKAQLQAMNQLADIDAAKEIAKAALDSISDSVLEVRQLKDFARLIGLSKKLIDEAKDGEGMMKAFGMIAAAKSNLGDVGYGKNLFPPSSPEQISINKTYNEILNDGILLNSDIFGDASVIQEIIDSINGAASDSSKLNIRRGQKKENSTDLYDRISRTNDTLKMGINRMQALSEDLVPNSLDQESPALAFANLLRKEIGDTVDNFSRIETEYENATAVLNDFYNVHGQLRNPNSEFELQTLRDLADNPSFQEFGLAEHFSAIADNFESARKALGEKEDIARAKITDAEAVKKNKSILDSAKKAFKQTLRSFKKSKDAAPNIADSTASTVSSTVKTIASLKNAMVGQRAEKARLSSETSALRKSAQQVVKDGRKASLEKIAAEGQARASVVRGIKETAANQIKVQRASIDELLRQRRELEGGPNLEANQDLLKQIDQQLQTLGEEVKVFEEALTLANDALNLSRSDLKVTKEGEKLAKQALKTGELERKQAAEKAVKGLYDALEKRLAEPSERLAKAEADELEALKELAEAVQYRETTAQAPEISTMQRLQEAQKAQARQPGGILSSFMRSRMATRGAALLGGAAAGPVVGVAGLAAAAVQTRKDPLGAFSIARFTEQAISGAAKKIDNTMNRLFSNQRLTTSEGAKQYKLGRSSLIRALNSVVLLQDSPAYVLTQEEAQKQRDALREIFSNPKKMSNLLNKAFNSAPEEFGEANQKLAMRIIEAARDVFPPEQEKSIFDKTQDQFSREELLAISNFNNMVTDPITYTMYKAATGTLSSADIDTLRQVSPKAAVKVIDQMMNSVQSFDGSIPFSTQVMIANAVGAELMPLLNKQTVLGLQNFFSQPSPTDQGQATLNPEGVNRLKGTAQANMTQTQSVEAVGVV
jgi:hypothetical protein